LFSIQNTNKRTHAFFLILDLAQYMQVSAFK